MGSTSNLTPYAGLGVSVELQKSSVMRVGLGWQKADYGSSVFTAGVSYSYHW
jgi:hypothetical protein